jgi:hypothetical protein
MAVVRVTLLTRMWTVFFIPFSLGVSPTMRSACFKVPLTIRRSAMARQSLNGIFFTKFVTEEFH